MVYWLNLFTVESWLEFVAAGSQVSGFSPKRWKTVQRIRPGDRLICYLTGISRFVAVIEVTSEGFQDDSKIWASAVYPSRLKVKPIVALTPETAVLVSMFRERLSVFKDLKNPAAWTGPFRGSPARWTNEDGEVILQELLQAARQPTSLPFDARRAGVRPRNAAASQIAKSEAEPSPSAQPSTDLVPVNSEHDKIQLALAKLGSALGLSVWIARNDRNRVVGGQRLADLPRVLSQLPIKFDPETARTIELIDVLWVKGNAIVSAFEIESTTSIYSGLLRMSDLIAMQPNINVPLYIVAPDERRNKIMSEIDRPTFRRLHPPMRDICRYIPFNALLSKIGQVGEFVSYLKPEFVDEIAEVCGSFEDESDIESA